MVDQSVGCIVVDEEQFLRVEFQRTVQSEGYNTHVDDRRRAESVLLVQRKFLACADTIQKIGILRQWIGEFGQFAFPVGNIATEIRVEFPLGAFDVSGVRVTVVLSVQDDLASVVVRIFDLAPSTYCIRMLLR